jgi:ABC-type Fe3+ transport system permease subunit
MRWRRSQPRQPYPPPTPRNGLGIASLVLGIFALVFSWLPFGGAVLGICAVVTGFLARGRVKRGEANNNAIAIASIVLGKVAIIIGGLIVLSMLYLIIGHEECLEHARNRYEYGQC